MKVLYIDRHRMATDGAGVTTLVVLAGCPLACRYCINKKLMRRADLVRDYTTPQLIEALKIDHCYFVYSGGGITFGGGEPLLQAEAIADFAHRAPKEWAINIETSLQIDATRLRPLLNKRFHYTVDIKSLNPDIYKKYTDGDLRLALQNLKRLQKKVPASQLVVRVPSIPRFTTEDDVRQTVAQLEAMGIEPTSIEQFAYIEKEEAQ